MLNLKFYYFHGKSYGYKEWYKPFCVKRSVGNKGPFIKFVLPFGIWGFTY